jgi:hypothetical protein
MSASLLEEMCYRHNNEPTNTQAVKGVQIFVCSPRSSNTSRPISIHPLAQPPKLSASIQLLHPLHSPQLKQEARRNKIRKTSEQLRIQISPTAHIRPTQVQRDHFGESRWEHHRQPVQRQERRHFFQARNLSAQRTDARPVYCEGIISVSRQLADSTIQLTTQYRTADQREENQHAVPRRWDPNRKHRDRAGERNICRHLYPTKPVRYQPCRRPTNPSAQIEHRRQNPSLLLRKTSNLHRITRHTIQNHNIPQNIRKRARKQQQAIIPLEQMRRKPQLRRLDLRIAIANQRRPNQMAHQTTNPRDPQRPRQRKPPNHSIRRERKRNPPKPTPRARNPTCKTPPPQKPLRHNLHARRENRSHACADRGALREVQLPGLRGERRGDETRGHEDAAAGHDEFAAELAGQDCPEGAEEQGAAED